MGQVYADHLQVRQACYVACCQAADLEHCVLQAPQSTEVQGLEVPQQWQVHQGCSLEGWACSQAQALQLRDACQHHGDVESMHAGKQMALEIGMERLEKTEVLERLV